MEIAIDNIYIVHALQGYEAHEERLIKIFKDLNLSFEFVTDGSPTLMTDETKSKYFCKNINSILSKGALSCTLNHIYCYQKMIENEDKYAVVFENDPFFLTDFKVAINKICEEADNLKPGFIISLENSTLRFPSSKEIKKDKLLYKATYGRCAGAYLIDLQAAKNIIDYLKNNLCCNVIDLWHNSLINQNIIEMYWAHPPLVEQGSHNGLMNSPLSTNSKNIARRIKWLAQKFYKTNIYRHFK
ncbi:glycosyltransferase family 25 protein [Pedobacter sp. SD-b]|uniref:Glycosyltransferase family 25 protein n=1 Tax=Pedobacter segetis TaxID=2793069 RepID=A0ABS1BNN5_9SPHI|nr:glycosyltransferase family 25 protein [Pedobacter segetis]MBK0384502.1 glycosyltransferase family 25 protein [Pedobacter segetis]